MTASHTSNVALDLARSAYQDGYGAQPTEGDFSERTLDLIRRLSPEPSGEPDWKHPKLQALLASEARLKIERDMIATLIDNPQAELYGLSDYETELTEKLRNRAAQPPEALPAQLLDVHSICDERDRLRAGIFNLAHKFMNGGRMQESAELSALLSPTKSVTDKYAEYVAEGSKAARDNMTDGVYAVETEAPRCEFCKLLTVNKPGLVIECPQCGKKLSAESENDGRA